MIIITKPTQATAQALANRCHAYLIATDPAYASSVLAGQTKEWAIPSQADGETVWSVPVDERCFGCLTADEYTPPVMP